MKTAERGLCPVSPNPCGPRTFLVQGVSLLGSRRIAPNDDKEGSDPVSHRPRPSLPFSDSIRIKPMTSKG
jgi:hypothetical protein